MLISCTYQFSEDEFGLDVATNLLSIEVLKHVRSVLRSLLASEVSPGAAEVRQTPLGCIKSFDVGRSESAKVGWHSTQALKLGYWRYSEYCTQLNINDLGM